MHGPNTSKPEAVTDIGAGGRLSDRVKHTRDWIFLRHGESTANAARRLSGWEDVGLTELGRTQAQQAGAQLANWSIERVLVSDLSRAIDTAHLALTEWQRIRGEPKPNVAIYDAFRERNLGDFQGRHLDELRSSGQTERLLGWTTRPPNGESNAELAARALTALANLPATKGPTLLVAHGGLLRVLLGLLDERPIEEIGSHRIANCEPHQRSISESRWATLAEQHGVCS